MEDDDKLFRKGIRFRDNNKFNEAIQVFHEFIQLYPIHDKIAGVYIALSGIYFNNVIDYKKSLFYAKKCKKLKSDCELASFLIYLNYASLNMDEKAIKEMISFLKKNKADLYKTTIEELLEGLKNGYMTNYEKQILDMAKKNDML